MKNKLKFFALMSLIFTSGTIYSENITILVLEKSPAKSLLMDGGNL